MSLDIHDARLEKRRDILLEHLRGLGNLMRGSLYTAQVRCGSQSCECAKAKSQRHAKVHLSVNVGGHTRNVYVGESRADRVASLIVEYNRARRIIEELTEINIELLRPARKRKATKEVKA